MKKKIELNLESLAVKSFTTDDRIKLSGGSPLRPTIGLTCTQEGPTEEGSCQTGDPRKECFACD